MSRGKQSTRRRRKRMLVPKARAGRSKAPSPESETSAASFFKHTLSTDDLFRRRQPIALHGGENPPDEAGVLDELLAAYDQYERWLIGRGQPSAKLREPNSLWPARLPEFSDPTAREQVELVHHATDALHRVQDSLEGLRQPGPDLSRQTALDLAAEVFTAFLPIVRHPASLFRLLTASYGPKAGHHTATEKRRNARDTRLAPYQEKATAMWRTDPSLSRLKVTKALVNSAEGSAEEKRLLHGWLYDNLKKPEILS